MTYKALGGSIANYAAPVWSTNASGCQILARYITLSETEMLQVGDQLTLLSVHYLVQYLDTENVCHYQDGSSTKRKEGEIFTRDNQTVLPLLAFGKHIGL